MRPSMFLGTACALFLVTVSPAAAADPLTRRCTNDDDGFSVSYPGDWFTNDPASVDGSEDQVSSCSLFAPFDDIVVYPEVTNVPIFMKHQSTGADGGTPVTIDGYRGIIVDDEHPGPNRRWHTYYVPLDHETVFVAFAFDNGSAPYDEAVAVLDAMMATVDLDGDGLPNVAMPRPTWPGPAGSVQVIGIALLTAAGVATFRRAFGHSFAR